MKHKLVGPAEFAEWNGVSRRLVWNWISDEGMPCIRGNRVVQIDTAQAQKWLTEREVRNQAVSKDSKASLAEERKRLITAQADKEELENEKRRGEVIYFETAVDVITSVVSLVTSRLEGVAGRLAADLVNESNPAVIRPKLLAEHRAVRQSLADATRELAEQTQVVVSAGEHIAPSSH